jgi:hypothetical protein
LVGSNRAFALRLMAQTALCQMQIERNTRPAAIMGRAQPPPIPRGASECQPRLPAKMLRN